MLLNFKQDNQLENEVVSGKLPMIGILKIGHM